VELQLPSQLIQSRQRRELLSNYFSRAAIKFTPPSVSFSLSLSLSEFVCLAVSRRSIIASETEWGAGLMTWGESAEV
jgi:hypothetical protein